MLLIKIKTIRGTSKLYPKKSHRASEYFKFLLYLHDAEKPNFQTSISNVINNTHYQQLATGGIGKNIHKNSELVVTDGKLNDAIIRHALDTKDKHILSDPNPLQVTFRDIKKIDALNPIIGKV